MGKESVIYGAQIMNDLSLEKYNENIQRDWLSRTVAIGTIIGALLYFLLGV
jgi:hypothetical protein